MSSICCAMHVARQTGIVVYSSSSLPAESFVSTSTNNSYNPNIDDLIVKSKDIYKISNVEYICSISLDSAAVSPGSDIRVSLDFSDGIQKCSSLKAVLVMSERRLDNSRIQVSYKTI